MRKGDMSVHRFVKETSSRLPKYFLQQQASVLRMCLRISLKRCHSVCLFLGHAHVSLPQALKGLNSFLSPVFSQIYKKYCLLINKKSICILSFLLINSVWAKDCGVHGPLYLIQERSLLGVIQERLKRAEEKGVLKTLQEHVKQKILAGLVKPLKIPRTQTARSFLFDPTLTVLSDLKDHSGRLIHAQGRTINPLHSLSWGRPLILLDGSDPEQLNWALAQEEAKWVLVAGDPFQLEAELKRPLYFDQGGKIVERFSIQHVPCRISQQGERLLVEELRPELQKPASSKREGST